MNTGPRLLEVIDGLLPALAEGKSYGTRRARSAVRAALNAAEAAIAPQRNVAAEREAERAYRTLKDGFQDRLQGLLADFQGERVTKGEFRRRMQDAMRESYEAAYRLGLRRGGTRQPVEPEDLAWLKGARAEEYGYLKGFIDAVEEGTGKMPYEQRMQLYVNTLDGIFWHGQVEAFDDTTEIDWVLGIAEHCEDCLRLAANSPYTKAGGAKPLPTTPRSGQTRCLSRCACKLVFRRGAVTPEPEEFPRGGARPEERIPTGFRRPNEAEKTYIENLMSRITFARELVPQLEGAERKAQVLARHQLADRLLRFLEERKIWVKPTWAAGNRAYGGAIHRPTLEEVLRGRDLGPADLRAMQRIRGRDFDDILDRFEAAVVARRALTGATAGVRARADEIERAANLVVAAGIAGALTAQGEPEEPDEDERDDLREEITTTAAIAPKPQPAKKDLRDVAFAVGQRFRLPGSPFVWKVAAIAVEGGHVAYSLEDTGNPERTRAATEADLAAAEEVTLAEALAHRVPLAEVVGCALNELTQRQIRYLGAIGVLRRQPGAAGQRPHAAEPEATGGTHLHSPSAVRQRVKAIEDDYISILQAKRREWEEANPQYREQTDRLAERTKTAKMGAEREQAWTEFQAHLEKVEGLYQIHKAAHRREWLGPIDERFDALSRELKQAHRLPVEIEGGFGGTGKAEYTAKVHAEIASIPQGLLRRFRDEGWGVRLGSEAKEFTVAGRVLREAGHADFVKKEVFLNESAVGFSFAKEGIRTLQHEFGHAGVSELAGRIADAQSRWMEYDPKSPRQGLDKYSENPKERMAIERARRYVLRVGNALRSFDDASHKEGGVTEYAKSWLTDERGKVSDIWELDLGHAPPPGRSAHNPRASISRGANENFAELFEESRSNPQKMEQWAKTHPRTIGAFRVLFRELNRERPGRLAGRLKYA